MTDTTPPEEPVLAWAQINPREGTLPKAGIYKNKRSAEMCIQMRKMSLLAATFLVLAGPAMAQSVGEKTGVNSALGITPHTSDFVKEAAQSDMFEIQSSQLAATKTQGPVQTFASQMVTDHTKTTNDLKGLVGKTKIQLPTSHEQLAAKHVGQAEVSQWRRFLEAICQRSGERTQNRCFIIQEIFRRRP